MGCSKGCFWHPHEPGSSCCCAPMTPSDVLISNNINTCTPHRELQQGDRCSDQGHCLLLWAGWAFAQPLQNKAQMSQPAMNHGPGTATFAHRQPAANTPCTTGRCECPFGWSGPTCGTPLLSACRTSLSDNASVIQFGSVWPRACECVHQVGNLADFSFHCHFNP